MHVRLARGRFHEHPADFRNRDEPLAAGHAIAGADLPARVRAEIFLVDDQAGAARVEGAVLDLFLQQPDARVGFLQLRPDVLALRFLLRELEGGALAISRVRLLDQHVGSPPQESEILFGLLQIVAVRRSSSRVMNPSPAAASASRIPLLSRSTFFAAS